MIKTLYNIFSWVPVLGQALKAAYIGSLIKSIKEDLSSKEPTRDLSDLKGKELEDALSDEANDIVEEVESELELDSTSIQLIRPKLIEYLVSKWRSKYIG
jgi:hypothetical protein|tara:strand:+ start:707 stop:1006 length:300 start_codon:yes stop_codon:yes gene_type:complete